MKAMPLHRRTRSTPRAGRKTDRRRRLRPVGRRQAGLAMVPHRGARPSLSKPTIHSPDRRGLVVFTGDAVPGPDRPGPVNML